MNKYNYIYRVSVYIAKGRINRWFRQDNRGKMERFIHLVELTKHPIDVDLYQEVTLPICKETRYL